MNKVELIERVATMARLNKKDAKLAVEAVFGAILEDLSAGNSVKVAGFGNFEVKERAERDGMNPVTKEKIHIPAQKAITFHASKPAKDAVNA